MDWNVLAIAAVAAIGAFIGAYFSERGKIRAQRDALESIVSQEFAKAKTQEDPKQRAIVENLQNLDTQRRTLTTTQKQIEARISGELWYRQTTWNEKKELYGELIRAVIKLRDCLSTFLVANRRNDKGSGESGDERSRCAV